MTRFLITRGTNATRYRHSVSIATGVVTTNRVSNDMVLLVDTQGAAASDDLDTLTSTDVSDVDVITIVGFDPTRIVTVKHGTGNIFLSNSADFVTGDQTRQLVLRYLAGNWREVSRTNTLPTVANQRLASVPTPIAGANKRTFDAGGGTDEIEPGVSKGYQIYDGTANLAGSWVVQIKAVPTTPYQDGDTVTVDYRALLTVGANSVTIFGIVLTTAQALEGRILVHATYKLSNTTWYYSLVYKANGVDVDNKAHTAATYEPVLGSPAANGFILSSTTGGVRSWIPNPNGPAVRHTPVAINATATATAAQVLSGYITSTSAAATVITLPTGTVLGSYIDAAQGTTLILYIDNTAGANTVTIAVNTNAVLSAAAVANGASMGLLTVPIGVTGQGAFRLMFSSATAYTFTRIA